MPQSLQKELRFGTPEHRKVLEFVRSRRKASMRKMKNFHKRWDDADDSFRAYQPANEVDDTRKRKRKVLGQHDYTTITVPYTFAIIMTAHTYWSSVFLSRSPIYQLQGRHGETQDAVQGFEAVLDYQRLVGKHLVPLFNWIFDMAKYELGIIGSYWEKQERQISRIVEVPVTFAGIQIAGKTKEEVQSETVLKYEGNRLFNVRPYDFFPDPRVALTEFQRGEFCGRDTQIGWHEVIARQRQGYYFNIPELAKRMEQGFDTETQGSPRIELPDSATQGQGERIPGPGFVKIHEMTIRLPPKILGLSASTRIENWFFTIANDDIVIGAAPQGLYHDEFPFDLMEYGIGAHEFMKMGLIEVMQPLVDTISWLLNSHFYNVRKALNDVRVVDPSRVVMKDLTSPVERGIVRLKPEAYGSPANQAIHQLTVPDMTRTHLQDIRIIEQMLQRISGVVDELMGLGTGPSRESATGVRTRTGFAANRLRTVAEYNSALGMSSLIAKLVSNTQQLMSADQKFRIAGASGLQNAQRFMDVNKETIAGQFDFVPVDGSLPIDRLAQANFWKELTIQLSSSPLAAEWNLSEMVAHIMRLQGEHNIDRFRLNLEDPETLANEVQKGNLVPVDGGGGNAGGPRAAASAGGPSGSTL